MICKLVQGRLSAFIDRELGPEEVAMIRRHLVDCGCCRQEEEELRSLKSVLSALQSPDPAIDFENRLLARLQQAEKPMVKHGWGLERWALAACLALVTMVATFSGALSHRSDPIPSGLVTDIRSDVVRDQVVEATSFDPAFGAPVMATADDVR